MLRCAGCGELVSEFAARCPACRHETDDAEDVPAVPGPSATPRAGDAAEGPTPYGPEVQSSGTSPGRRGRAGWLGAGTVTVLAAVILSVMLASTGSGDPRSVPLPSAVRALPGRVVVEAEDGALSLSQPDGAHAVALRPSLPGSGFQAVLVGADDAIVSRSGRRFAESDTALAGSLPPGSTIVAAHPFTDGTNGVVAVTGPEGPRSVPAVWAVSLAGHRAVSLGSANDAAGDPEAFGAFVAVAAPAGPRTGSTATYGLADSRVEIRDAGRAAVVLATAAQLIRDAGLDPGQPVNLTVFPDHAGGKVAVVVNPVAGRETDSPVVVLDRRGGVVEVVAPGRGPTEYTTLFWSPDDTSLAYSTFTSTGTALGVVKGGQAALQPLQPDSSVTGCTWSPDSAWVLCLATSSFVDNWLLARNDPALYPIYSLPARGDPVLWIP